MEQSLPLFNGHSMDGDTMEAKNSSFEGISDRPADVDKFGKNSSNFCELDIDNDKELREFSIQETNIVEGQVKLKLKTMRPAAKKSLKESSASKASRPSIKITIKPTVTAKSGECGGNEDTVEGTDNSAVKTVRRRGRSKKTVCSSVRKESDVVKHSKEKDVKSKTAGTENSLPRCNVISNDSFSVEKPARTLAEKSITIKSKDSCHQTCAPKHSRNLQSTRMDNLLMIVPEYKRTQNLTCSGFIDSPESLVSDGLDCFDSLLTVSTCDSITMTTAAIETVNDEDVLGTVGGGTGEDTGTNLPIPIDTGMVIEICEDVEGTGPVITEDGSIDFGYRSYAHNFGADAVMSEKDSDITPNVTSDEQELECQVVETASKSTAICKNSATYSVHTGYSPKVKASLPQKHSPKPVKVSPKVRKGKEKLSTPSVEKLTNAPTPDAAAATNESHLHHGIKTPGRGSRGKGKAAEKTPQVKDNNTVKKSPPKGSRKQGKQAENPGTKAKTKGSPSKDVIDVKGTKSKKSSTAKDSVTQNICSDTCTSVSTKSKKTKPTKKKKVPTATLR